MQQPKIKWKLRYNQNLIIYMLHKYKLKHVHCTYVKLCFQYEWVSDSLIEAWWNVRLSQNVFICYQNKTIFKKLTMYFAFVWVFQWDDACNKHIKQLMSFVPGVLISDDDIFRSSSAQNRHQIYYSPQLDFIVMYLSFLVFQMFC